MKLLVFYSTSQGRRSHVGLKCHGTDTAVYFSPTQQPRIDAPAGGRVGLFPLLAVFQELGVSATFSM